MNLKKIFVLITLLIIILIASVIFLFAEFFNGKSANLNSANESKITEVLGDTNFKFYFNHGGHFPNYNDTKGSFYFSYEYKDKKENVTKVTDDKIIDKYNLSANNTTTQMIGMGFDKNGITNYFSGELKNSRGDRLTWIKDKKDYGNIKLTKANGESRELLVGGRYSLSPLPVVPEMISIRFLTDDLIIFEIRGNVQLNKLMTKCFNEIPLLQKVAIISPCDNDNILHHQLSDYIYDEALYSSQFEKFYPDCGGITTIGSKNDQGKYTEKTIKGCDVYSQYNGIIIMNVNTSQWSEITLGNAPIPESNISSEK